MGFGDDYSSRRCSISVTLISVADLEPELRMWVGATHEETCVADHLSRGIPYGVPSNAVLGPPLIPPPKPLPGYLQVSNRSVTDRVSGGIGEDRVQLVKVTGTKGAQTQ